MTATPTLRSAASQDRVVLDVQNLREVGPVEAAGLIREAQALFYKRLDPSIWRALDELAPGAARAGIDAGPPGSPGAIAAAVTRERNRFFPRFRAEFDALFDARRKGAARTWGKGGGQVPTLALVEEGDLSGQVALKTAVAAMRAAARAEGFGFDLRARAVLREPPADGEFVNPWGAELVCDALGNACRALWPDKPQWHAIMGHLVRALTPELVAVNKEQDALLQQHDILPKIEVRMRKRAPAPAVAADAAEPANGAAADPDGAHDLYHQVAALFAQQYLHAGARQAAAPSPPETRAMLMRALYLLDARSAGHAEDAVWPGATSPGPAGTMATAPAGANAVAPAAGLASLASSVVSEGGPTLDPVTIEILTAVLNEVFDNRWLSAEIKTLFGRLQIPLLKAALIDPGVLAQPGHGVRRFFDALAAASVGLRPELDEDADFLALAHHLVAEIRDQPADNLETFVAARGELESFLDAERARYNLNLEQSLAPLVVVDEQSVALARARTAIAVHVAGRQVPPELRAYLGREGAVRLAGPRMRHRPGDADWQRELAWIDDLVFSVAPPQDPHARPRLLQLVPKLVRDISEDWPEDDAGSARRKAFVAWLYKAHLRALSSLTLATAANGGDAPTLPLPEPAATPASVAPTPLSPAAPATVPEQAGDGDTLLRGDWCAFEAADGQPPLLARFAWRAPHGTQLLFTHRDGTIAVVHTPESLAALFRAGTVKVVFESASLFERAMERMIAARTAAAP